MAVGDNRREDFILYEIGAKEHRMKKEENKIKNNKRSFKARYLVPSFFHSYQLRHLLSLSSSKCFVLYRAFAISM
jgi:hypothetical protein